MGVKGGATGDIGTNGGQVQGAADLWWGNTAWALHAGGGGQRNGDYSTPEGAVDNTQARSGFGSFGLSWTAARGYVGANYAYEDTRYGLPYVEEGQVELTPRRSIVNVRGEMHDLEGFFSSIRGSYAGRWYRHEEIVAGEVGTRFGNDTHEFEFLGNHRPYGRFGGTVGARALVRAFTVSGDEVTVLSGTQTIGQGLETVYTQLVSEALGVPPAKVRIVQGDTDAVLSGVGSYGSRSLYIGGSALSRPAHYKSGPQRSGPVTSLLEGRPLHRGAEYCRGPGST